MTQTEIDFTAAREAAERGIQSSAQHAEDDRPGWGESALAWLRFHAEVSEGEFTMEQFRQMASMVLPEPPDLRAWGSVTQKAIRQGIIRKTGGYAPAASSNGSPKPLYVGCV
jgi:hypothetical protein